MRNFSFEEGISKIQIIQFKNQPQLDYDEEFSHSLHFHPYTAQAHEKKKNQEKLFPLAFLLDWSFSFWAQWKRNLREFKLEKFGNFQGCCLRKKIGEGRKIEESQESNLC